MAWHRTGNAKTQGSLLHFLTQAMLPERKRIAEEHRALVVEALERVEAAVLGAVAVRPIVVAGREHGRRPQRVEIGKALEIQGVGAGRGRR
jgi:hypothetical protein